MQEKKGGSFLTGLIGALVGAVIGAAVWALVGILGYMASIVGFLTAWLAAKGYDLLKGRPGSIKKVVLIVCVLLAVVLGNAGTYAWEIHDVYKTETAEIPEAEMVYVVSEGEFFRLMMDEKELQTEFVKDLGMGLLFAGLGCFSVIFSDSKKKKQPKPEEISEENPEQAQELEENTES